MVMVVVSEHANLGGAPLKGTYGAIFVDDFTGVDSLVGRVPCCWSVWVDIMVKVLEHDRDGMKPAHTASIKHMVKFPGLFPSGEKESAFLTAEGFVHKPEKVRMDKVEPRCVFPRKDMVFSLSLIHI